MGKATLEIFPDYSGRICSLEAYWTKVVGIGDASGILPIDQNTCDYDAGMIEKFDEVGDYDIPWKLSDILPEARVAGKSAGILSEAGAKLLDPSGRLQAGIPLCPPEGDGITGMVATNSVGPGTGNISAGTSIFTLVILEKMIEKPTRILNSWRHLKAGRLLWCMLPPVHPTWTPGVGIFVSLRIC